MDLASTNPFVTLIIGGVPGSGYDSMARTLTHTLWTLRVNDDAFHRVMQTSSSLDSSR
jgi:hypothetical protein